MNKKNVEKKKEKINKFLSEFKSFIMRGNVIDLAIGVIIASSFNAIVSSLVNDILMPLIGLIIGGIDLSGLTFNVNDAVINYGKFLQQVLDFLIVAFSVFVFVKTINKLMTAKDKKKEEEKKSDVPKKSDEVLLLEEIRDLLKKNNK